MLEHALFTLLEYLIPILELMGVIVVVAASVTAFAKYFLCLARKQPFAHLAPQLALGLEFLMAGEILKTIMTDSYEGLIVLGIIVVLRSAMALLIHFEMKGQH